MYSMVFQKPVPVSSAGMICSIALLFGMLVLVFMAILFAGWKMTKTLGIGMLYSQSGSHTIQVDFIPAAKI